MFGFGPKLSSPVHGGHGPGPGSGIRGPGNKPGAVNKAGFRSRVELLGDAHTSICVYVYIYISRMS